MVRVITLITLDLPAGDPNIDEGLTFTMDGTVSGTGSHAWDFNVHWEFDQGTGTWIDIPSSGSQLTTANTNPVNNESNANLSAITVTGVGAGSYQIRIHTFDNNDSSNEDFSSEQTVTVNVAAAGRRRINIA